LITIRFSALRSRATRPWVSPLIRDAPSRALDPVDHDPFADDGAAERVLTRVGGVPNCAAGSREAHPKSNSQNCTASATSSAKAVWPLDFLARCTDRSPRVRQRLTTAALVVCDIIESPDRCRDARRDAAQRALMLNTSRK